MEKFERIERGGPETKSVTEEFHSNPNDNHEKRAQDKNPEDE